jgi:hypothetical protein
LSAPARTHDYFGEKSGSFAARPNRINRSAAFGCTDGLSTRVVTVYWYD